MPTAASLSNATGATPRADWAAHFPGSRPQEFPAPFEFQAVPWWLWWNILSADAPGVAVVWAVLFARACGARLPAADAAVLALSVWVIYMSDRLLDGWTAGNRAAFRARHLFCREHRFWMAALVVLAGSAILWLVERQLPPAEISAGVKLGFLVVLYMAGIHAGNGRMERFVPKEMAVGILFACGATLPIWSRSARLSMHAWISMALFALLCGLNCLSIECWENDSNSASVKQAAQPFIRWTGSRIHWIAAILGFAAVSACFIPNEAGHFGAASFALFVGALLILGLNSARNMLSRAALRVLADMALLVPAVLALAIRG